MSDSNSHGEPRTISRRQLIRTTAVGGAAAIAGCGGDSDGGDGGSGDGGSGDGSSSDGSDSESTSESMSVADQTMVTAMNFSPDQMQFNPFNPQNEATKDQTPGEFLYDQYLRYQPASGEYTTNVISDYEIEGESATLSVGGMGHVWHDGSPVTAQDVATHWRIHKHLGHQLWQFVESLEVADESTLNVQFDGQVNDDVFLQMIGNMKAKTKTSKFGEWATKLEEAGSEDEVDSVLNELSGVRMEEPIGNGPFQFVSKSKQNATLERFEDYPRADNINFNEIKYKQYVENSVRVQALISGDLDAHPRMYIEQETQQTMPDHIKRVHVPDFGGYTLRFNHDNEHLQDRRVRQAIAHLINRKSIADLAPGNVLTGVPCGLPTQANIFQNVVGDQASQFEDYSPESSDTERASELLQSAGYSKQNGTWTDDSGNTLSLEQLSPPWATMSSISQALNQRLTRFGIDAQLSTIESSTFFSRWNNSDFGLILWWWGASARTPNPWFTLSGALQGDAELYNYPAEVDINWPPGESTQTVNVREQINALAKESGSSANEIAVQLAYLYNQDLPDVPLTQGVTTSFMATDDWTLPEDSDPSTRKLNTSNPNASVLYPHHWLVRTGGYSAKQ